MSSSSGPSTFRRSARSRNASESSEASLSSCNSKNNAASSSRQVRCPADSGSPLDSNSPDRVKRKKRRKNVHGFNLEERKKLLERRMDELNRRKRLEEELIRLKLRENRIPVVLVTRLKDDHHSQPKHAAEEEKKREEKQEVVEEEEKKVEKCVQLPRVTIPSKIDPKILKHGLVVKINKRHTDNLIEVRKKRLQRQLNTEVSVERQEDDSADSVIVNSDSNKCVDRLTEKLESCLANDDECTKNKIVSSSGRKHMRINIDKSNNDRLPDRLLEGNSKLTLNSISEILVSESQPDSSKVFIYNNRKLKRNAVDQSNNKYSTDLVVNKPKCTENTVEKSDEKHSETSNIDVKKYSKNSNKSIKKHSQHLIDRCNKKHVEISDEINETSTLFSEKETKEKQSEIPHEMSKKVFINLSEINTRPRRNLTNKISEKNQNNSAEISSEISQKLSTDKFSRNVDNEIQDDSKNQTESYKKITRKAADKNEVHIESKINNTNCTEKLVKENRKFTKKQDKKMNECSKNETECNKRIKRQTDDKSERHSESLIDSYVKNIDNNIKDFDKKLPEKLEKDNENSIKNQTEKNKRSTRSTDDNREKNNVNALENNRNCTQNIVESNKHQSQNVDKNIQKCSINLNENNRRPRRNSEKSVHFVEENSENHSKNIDGEVKKVFKKSVQLSVTETSKNFSVTVDDTVKNIYQKSIPPIVKDKNENLSKNFHDANAKVFKFPIEINKQLRVNLVDKSKEKLVESLTENHFNFISSSDENKPVPKIYVENNQKTKRKNIRKNCESSEISTVNTPLCTENLIKSNIDKQTENLNKNITANYKIQNEISRRRTRKGDYTGNSTDNKLNRVQYSIEKNKMVSEDLNVDSDLKTVTENETATKQSLQQKYDKHHGSIVESLSNSVKNYTEDNKQKLPKDLDSDIIENITIPLENKRSKRKFSSEENKQSTENVTNDDLNSIQNSLEKNKTDIAKESFKKVEVYPKIQIENIIVSRSVSSNKQEILTNKVNCALSDKKYEEKLPVELDRSIERSKTQVKNKRVLRSSLDKQDKHPENIINDSSDTKNIDNHEVNFPKELQKVSKEYSQNQIENHKRVTRKSSIDKHDRNIPKSEVKNLDYSQNSADQNQDKYCEVSSKIVKENSKISHENKRITRNLSPDKNESRLEIPVASNSDCTQNLAKKNDSDLVNDSQKISNECFKSSKVTRQLSCNKHEKKNEHNVIHNTDFIQNKMEKSEDKILEESQKSIKDTSKFQIDCYKRVTRKSLPDKQERYAENLIVNNLDAEQNSIEENHEIFFERLDNKENSKTAIESNMRITRNSPLKREKSKNFIENDVECSQTLIEENKEKHSENIINNIKIGAKNISDNNKIFRNTSVDSGNNETQIENLIKISSVSLQNLVEENSEKQYETPTQNHTRHSKDFVENNRKITRSLSEKSFIKLSENFTQSNQSSAPYSVDSSDERYSSISEKSNKNCAMDIIKDNKTDILKTSKEYFENVTKDNSECVQTVQSSLSSDNEKHTSTSDSNNKKCSTDVIENNKEITGNSPEKFSKTVVIEKLENVQNSISAPSEDQKQIQNFVENNERHSEFPAQHRLDERFTKEKHGAPVCSNKIGNEEGLNTNIEICSDVIDSKSHVENLSTNNQEKEPEFSLENEEHKEKSIGENKKSTVENLDEITVRCSKRIASMSALKNNESQIEHSCEEFDNLHESTKNSFKKTNEKNIQYKIDAINNDHLITDDAKIQDNLDEKICKMTEVPHENNKDPTENLVEYSEEIDNMESAVNSIQEIYENYLNDQNFDESAKNCSKELLENFLKFNYENNDESRVETCEKIFENTVNSSKNNGENSSLNQTTRNLPVVIDVQKVMIHKKYVDAIMNDNATCLKNSAQDTKNLTLDIVTESNVNAEAYVKHRREITLMELKKKCTKNLGKKCTTAVLQKTPENTIESSQEFSSDSYPENATENEENFESCSDDGLSDENLADRLAHLNTLKIPPLKSMDSTDSSGKISTVCKNKQSKKILLKRSRTSIRGLKVNYHCRHCGANFQSYRDLKRHIKTDHRQRLVLKISKNKLNKHVSRIVQPIHNSKAKLFENNEKYNNKKTNKSDISLILPKEESLKSNEEIKSDNITEGEIKIIVRKENGSKNSHVVKEIKITPKSSDGNNSSQSPDQSSDQSSKVPPPPPPEPTKRRPGRPRKYPIFTEVEIAEQKKAEKNKSDEEKKDKEKAKDKDKEDEKEKTIKKKNLLIFEPVESIMIDEEIEPSASKGIADISLKSKINSEISSSQTVVYNANSEISTLERRKVGRKRKRPLEVPINNDMNENTSSSEKVVDEKRQKISGNVKHIRCPLLSSSDLNLCAKFNIKKELVVLLTKIDSVPKVSEEFNANVINSERKDNDSVPKASNIEERPRRILKPKNHAFGEEEWNRESIKAAIRLNLKNKLENNNNNVNDIRKCLSSNTLSETSSATNDSQEAQGSKNYHQLDIKPAEELTNKIEENSSNSLEEIDDNQKFISETQLVVTPKRQPIDKAGADESQKAKLLMLMNATTPYETNNIVTTSTVIESPLSQSQIVQQQIQTQPLQLQMQQPQQFCILFIPDSLYSSDSSANKDVTPTATIVNFQPVPDSEIANKSLIYTPTTPTKIYMEEQHSVKPYVCTNCTEVLDMIGRLEASLGMTEEDKSAIKCPYCSNHFQSLFYLEYHVMQEHLKCENEKQCRHAGFNSLRIPTHEAASEFEIYITFALKCRSCYDIFNSVLMLNDHVMNKHKSLVRIKPTLPTSTSSSPSSSAVSMYPPFGKNGTRSAILQCPSDCVCRIGIRSTDTPLQRQQMLKRCPNAMRRLEKIEPAAYEVYTCTLCKSTFLMKDEVVDHLMKMHEVSCKFPCYTCLTSFRSLQMQENHRCSETTLQDLDKLLSIAILPSNVSGKTDNNKYLEREDSSTDEYGAIKNSTPKTPAATPPRNGIKRKNGTTNAAFDNYLSASAPKQMKISNGQSVPPINVSCRKRRRHCPKCKKAFAYRKSLHHHIIYEHILSDTVNDGPKNIVVELLHLLSNGRVNGERVEQLANMLNGCTDEDGLSLRSLAMLDEDESENCKEMAESSNEVLNERNLAQCAKCKTSFMLPANSGNLTKHNNHHLPSIDLSNLQLCENCDNSNGPKTRRRTIVNNGYHKFKSIDSDSTAFQQPKFQEIHPFACKKCTETFPTVLELKSHKRNVHTKSIEKQHACDICKKTFASARMLDKHKKIHRESVLDDSTKAEEDDSNRSAQSASDCNKDSEANDSLNDKANSSIRRDSSDSSSGGSKEPEEQLLNCSFCEEVCSSKVSLKNHLKREHGRRASICQFCNGLLIDTSEVRHMLDYHIVPTKLSPRHPIVKRNGSILQCDDSSCMEEDVDELIRTLGKHRLQSLMIYHDFEGKCNNAIMRCPICPELFATRESCRFHYVWIHDDNCLLCDENFRSGSSACQHKIDAHTSTASYLWCIQRLVTAIVNTLRLDPDQPSHVLYQILAMRLEEGKENGAEHESMIARCTTEKGGSEEAGNATERFLEEVVLSEDQLPDSSNIIEVVIGKEDSEDDLLSLLNLSPNYESCEQHKMPNAGAAPPEEEEDEETTSMTSVPITPPVYATTTSPLMTSPVVENYVTSGVCKYRLDNDEEQLVLVVTDEDLVIYRDDIGSLAERISATCDSLTLEEITDMLRAYFESVNMNSGESA